MRVLYLTTVPTPYKVAFFEELGKNCELTVLFENHEVSYRERSWMVHDFRNFNVVFLKGVNLKDKKISFEVIRYLSNQKYDQIIVGVYSTITQMIAQIYMRFKGVNYILSSDGGIVKNDSKFSRKIKTYFISSAKYWLSTGKETTKYLCYYGAKAEKIYVYPFTSIKSQDIMKVTVTTTNKKEFRKELGISEDNVVLSVGQFIPRKGMDILIRAAAELHEVGFYIIGGTPTKEYENLKNELCADNVHFIDFKQKEELAKYYKASDVFALATREDIWGLVINEAMAYGLPVITTDRCVAGLEMVQENVTGSIVPVDDVKALKRRIQYWLGKKNNAFQAVISIAQRYTIESMAKRHMEILDMINGEEG